MQSEKPLHRRHLHRSVSPPPIKRQRRHAAPSSGPNPSSLSSSPAPTTPSTTPLPTPAAVEAGQATITDHLSYFLTLFHTHSLPTPTTPRLPLTSLRSLYLRSAFHATGHNFIVHQHDHPRAGLHYDLRLQINPTSSCSWSVPYGLPGNPWESRHGRRQAIETRIHCLWNHLVEAASRETGSMLVWDTGEYEVLPFEAEAGSGGGSGGRETDEEDGESRVEANGAAVVNGNTTTECVKLDAAFRRGKIRLRLHGTRLPKGYTITFRLSSDSKLAAQKPLSTIRRGSSRRRKKLAKTPQTLSPSSGESAEQLAFPNASTSLVNDDGSNGAEADPSDDELHTIRHNNAYTGAFNSINSIHQRSWFLALDKPNSGFIRGKTKDGKVSWTAGSEYVREKYPFYVRGREVETSVVTGRKAVDVLRDEGVVGFVPRAGWRAVVS